MPVSVDDVVHAFPSRNHGGHWHANCKLVMLLTTHHNEGEDTLELREVVREDRPVLYQPKS